MKKIVCVLLLISVLLTFASCGEQPLKVDGEIEIKFFDAGKADCMLIKSKNATVVIDAGENSYGSSLVSYCKENGIQKIDAFIVTHFDKDHIGGADSLIYNVAIDTLYQPDYSCESKQYGQYTKAIEESGVFVTTLTENTTVTIDNVRYEIDVANESDYGGNSNNFSLVISMTYGKTNFLLAGDAENKRLKELLDEGVLPHTVLKVPHHGMEEERSATFFSLVNPDYAVITSSADEPESENIVSALESLKTKVFLTRNGTVTCISDGSHVTFNQ